MRVCPGLTFVGDDIIYSIGDFFVFCCVILSLWGLAYAICFFSCLVVDWQENLDVVDGIYDVRVFARASVGEFAIADAGEKR